LAITTDKEEKVMGVNYSSVLVVGLPQEELIREVVSKREVPVFNRKTGVQEGTEIEKDYKYFVGTTEVPDEESPTSFLIEQGLEHTSYVFDSEELLFGKVLSSVFDEGPCIQEVELTEGGIAEAVVEVKAIFKALGVDAEPKLYHALCAA
jgi:hypothetical protein